VCASHSTFFIFNFSSFFVPALARVLHVGGKRLEVANSARRDRAGWHRFSAATITSGGRRRTRFSGSNTTCSEVP
jgi:hypothetical protein